MLVTLFLYQTKQSFPLYYLRLKDTLVAWVFAFLDTKKIHCNCKQNVPKNQRYHRFSIPPRDFQLGWLDGKIAFPKKPKHYFSKKVANCIAKEPHTVGFNIHLRFVRILYVEFWLHIANESQFWNVNAQNVRLYFACIM